MSSGGYSSKRKTPRSSERLAKLHWRTRRSGSEACSEDDDDVGGNSTEIEGGAQRQKRTRLTPAGAAQTDGGAHIAGVDYVPDTPEEDTAPAASPSSGAVALQSAGGALLRLALRRSAEHVPSVDNDVCNQPASFLDATCTTLEQEAEPSQQPLKEVTPIRGPSSLTLPPPGAAGTGKSASSSAKTVSEVDDKWQTQLAAAERSALAQQNGHAHRAPAGIASGTSSVGGGQSAVAVAASPAKERWGDTPDSATLAFAERTEQEALHRRALAAAAAHPAAPAPTAAGDGGVGARESPVAVRHLAFTPVARAVLGDGVGRKGSSTAARLGGDRPLSHLGRSALQQAELLRVHQQERSQQQQQQLPMAHVPPLPMMLCLPSAAATTALAEMVRQHTPQPQGRPAPAAAAAGDTGGFAEQVDSAGRCPDGGGADGGGTAGMLLAADVSSSDEESGDEEAERNIPVLSQHYASPSGHVAHPNRPSPVANAASLGQPRQPSLPRSPPASSLEAYLPPAACAAMWQAGCPAELYGWQAECLCTAGVLQGRSLVYCAPTSGGKSLVAEILMLRRVLLSHRPAMLVLPFVALCGEKSAHLKRILEPLGKEVKDFYGGLHSTAALGPSTGVIVCTIEKANIMVNRLLEDQALGLLSCVVVDELHMVGDEDRGYQLELLLTKLRYAGAAAFGDEDPPCCHPPSPQQRGPEAGGGGDLSRPTAPVCSWDEDSSVFEGVQVVGMSATLPNVGVVARWLRAALYVTQYRPVPLKQLVKVGMELQDADGAVVRSIHPPEGSKAADPEHVAWLTRETVEGGHSVLLFCASKLWCEKTAKMLAAALEVPERRLPLRSACGNDRRQGQQQQPTRASICEQLRHGGAPHPELLAAMQRGVAFHHSGLENEERELVEAAYRCGAVSVLCATSTLAAGVNLPARRVIFRHAYIGLPDNILDATKYRQMAGRAGRAGIDVEGEAILLAGPRAPLPRLRALMAAGAAPVESCLSEDKKGMKRAMLEVVASGAVVQAADVERYIRCTLLAAMNSFGTVAGATKAALRWLGHRDHAFIFWDEASETYQPTAFGKAVLASGLPPELCMHVRADLARARESFVLTTELHLTYLCVPATEDLMPMGQQEAIHMWNTLYALATKLPPADRSVAQKVGLDFGYVHARSRGAAPPKATSGAAPAAAAAKAKAAGDDAGVAGGDHVAAAAAAAASEKRAEVALEQERVCRRFWAALILTDLLREMDPSEVCTKYGVARGAAQGLQEKAARHASMVASFCERLGWHDLETLVAKFQARVLHGVRPEVMSLMEIPYVKAATARLLYKAGLRTPEAVAAVRGAEVVASILAAGRPAAGRDGAAAAMALRQASRVVRGARELLSRRAKEMREQAAEALALVDDATRADAAETEAPPGPEVSAAAEQQQLDGNAAHAGVGKAGGSLQVFRACTAACDSESDSESGAPEVGAPEEAFVAEANQSSTELELSPDEWEFGGRQGAFVLVEARQVAAVRGLLEGGAQYARFAFVFDTAEVGPARGSAAQQLAVPRGPSAALHRSTTPAAQSCVAPVVSGGVRVDGVALSWRDGQAFYVPLQGAPAELASEVAALFASPALEKVTFDLKGQMGALARAMGPAALGAPWDHEPAVGAAVIALKDPLVDVRIAAFMATPDDERLSDGKANANAAKRVSGPYTAEGFAASRLGAVAAAAATRGMTAPPGPQQGPGMSGRRLGACRRAAMLRRTYALVATTLEAQGSVRALQRVEMPLVRLLASMESTGVVLDLARLDEEEPVIKRRIAELQQLATEVAQEFNLSSSVECSHQLYHKLNLPPPPSAAPLKGHPGEFSTKAESMMELAANFPNQPLPGIIAEFRSLTKLLSGFVDLLRSHAAVSAPSPGGPGQDLRRIRGSFNQTRAATGRLSMDEPNLQNVPRPLQFAVASTPGEGVQGDVHRYHVCNLRRAFVAPPGYLLLSADYKQLELRLVAHFSGDEALRHMLADGGVDPFEALAARWLGRPKGRAVTRAERDHAKKLAYGIMYGMGPAKLAQDMGLRGPGAETQARAAAAAFLDALPGVKRWVKAVEGACRRDSGVRTLAGRTRRLAHIQSSGRGSREAAARAERQAVNTVCQGSAADLAKRAMVAVVEVLAEVAPGAARLVLQIHDEFLLEVRQDAVSAVVAAVRAGMEEVWAPPEWEELAVPLRVRIAVGPSWGELEEVWQTP